MSKNNQNKKIQENREWSKEWELEKQTEGLDKNAIKDQNKIIKNIKQDQEDE